MSPFLAWVDFHARWRFARSTIPEGKWGTTRSLGEVSFELDFEHRHTSGRLSLLWDDQIVKQGDDRKYFTIGN